MEKIRNIKFSIDEGAIEFSFNDNETAYLQLPHIGDSQHQINGIDEDDWSDKEIEIYKQLERFYFDSFNDTECAAASVTTCDTIVHVEEITYKGMTVYVAFSEDDTEYILVESPSRDYYNKKALFDRFDNHTAYDYFGDDYSESDIIEKARKAGKESEDE